MPYRFLFKNKYFVWMLLGLVIQQASVGLSNYYLAQAATALTAGQNARMALAIFFALLLFPYVPGVLSLIELKKWYLSLRKNLVSDAAAKLFAKASLWSDQKARHERTALLVSESQIVLNDACHFCYETCSTVLNYSVNLVAMYYILHPSVAMAFLLGMGLAGLVSKIGQNEIARLAVQMEHQKSQVSSSLYGFWDNVVLGNTPHRDLWNRSFDVSISGLNQSTMRHERSSKGMSLLLMSISALPMLSVLAYRLFIAEASQTEMMVAAAMLPRMLQMINSSHVMFSLVTEFTSLESRLGAIFARLFAAEGGELGTRITFDKIDVEGGEDIAGGQKNIGEFLRGLAQQKSGYLTLRGANGSGKSSLLLLMKEYFADRAVLLPSQSSLLLAGDYPAEFSSGELQLARLQDLLKHRGNICLLDEWDANLDPINRRRCEEIVAQASKDQLIIDIRHSK